MFYTDKMMNTIEKLKMSSFRERIIEEQIGEIREVFEDHFDRT